MPISYPFTGTLVNRTLDLRIDLLLVLVQPLMMLNLIASGWRD